MKSVRLVHYSEMAVQIPTLISLTFLLLLVQTQSSSLDCENLDAAACKQRFGEHIDQEVKALQVEAYKGVLAKGREFYSKLLKDIPENSLLFEPTKKYLNTIDAAMPKLNKDMGGDILVKIIEDLKSLVEPDYKGIDEEARNTLNDLHLKHSYDEHSSEKREYWNQAHMKMIKLWDEHFQNIRPVDIAAYPEYEEINKEIQSSKPSTDSDTWQRIGIFFDSPYLRTLYKY